MKFELKMMIVGLLLLAVLLFNFIYIPGAGLYMSAYEVNETPVNYIEVTMEELDAHPYVKMAVMQPGTEIRVPTNKQSSVTFSRILWENKTNYIKPNNSYYKIRILHAD